MNNFQKLFILFLLPLITQCASIVKGSDQVITIDTPNCPGATCRLTNNDGTYFINKTPGTVSINKSGSALSVSCYKDAAGSSMSAESKVAKMAWGNILLGGIIGGGVDMATGAAYNYPNFLEHPLDCRDSVKSSSSKEGGLKLKSSQDSERDKKIEELQKALEELKKN